MIPWSALVRLADWTRQRLAALDAGTTSCPTEPDPLRPPAPIGSHNLPPALDLAGAPAGAKAKDAARPQPADRRTGRAATRRQGGGQ